MTAATLHGRDATRLAMESAEPRFELPPGSSRMMRS